MAYIRRLVIYSKGASDRTAFPNRQAEIVAATQVLVLDAASLLTQSGRANPWDYADELHLNDSGYAVLNRELVSILSKSH